MARPRAATLLLLLLGLASLLPEPCGGLPAQSAALKRKKKKRNGSVELRLLNESQAGGGAAATGAGTDYVQLALRKYLNNQELTEWLQSYEKRCKPIARLTKFGASAQERPLWALEISDRPGQVEAEPAVKYVGGVHGDEPTGRVLTLALAEWLCANHKSDPRAKRIVSTIHLWLVPAMNPDGFDLRSRGNLAGQDLNRDFPDRFTSPAMEPSGSEQPETRAMMDWSLRTGFVAGASMHEGALVANYPWDGTDDRSTRYEASPDDAAFRHLAALYATTHKTMAAADNTEFPNGGTTNGANWYPIYGSMQDWNYVVGRCMELTLELSPDKWPPESELPKLWEDNRDALLAFPLAAAYGGVWGSVRAEAKLRSAKGAELVPLGAANITVEGLATVTLTRDGLGDFYRPLAPGRYRVVVAKEGYKPFAVNLTVPDDGSGAQRHFVLAAEGSSSSGGVAYSLRSLGTGASEGGAAGVLPWKAAHRGRRAGGDGMDSSSALLAATRARDRALMLGVGAVVVYGLYFTHRRLQRKSYTRRK